MADSYTIVDSGTDNNGGIWVKFGDGRWEYAGNLHVPLHRQPGYWQDPARNHRYELLGLHGAQMRHLGY